MYLTESIKGNWDIPVTIHSSMIEHSEMTVNIIANTPVS